MRLFSSMVAEALRPGVGRATGVSSRMAVARPAGGRSATLHTRQHIKEFNFGCWSGGEEEAITA